MIAGGARNYPYIIIGIQYSSINSMHEMVMLAFVLCAEQILSTT